MKIYIGPRHKPFACAHTPMSNHRWPVVFRWVDMKRANGMMRYRWFYRLWVYSWWGQWSIDIDGGQRVNS
jgi:hypothetical protein